MFSLFRSKRNEALDAFARGLAEEVARRAPPDAVASAKGKKEHARVRKAVELACRQAEAFRRDNRLGVYAKARVGNTFKWELRERGYGDAFIDEATRGVILSLSGK